MTFVSATAQFTLTLRLEGLLPSCIDGKPDVGSRGCVEATEVGNYHPLPYVLPAAAIKVSSDATTALWLSRLASAIPCVGFVLVAIALLWDGSARSLMGLLGAVTPMVLFVCSIVNPNGLELAASVAVAASVLRLARAPARAPNWVWVALAVTSAIVIVPGSLARRSCSPTSLSAWRWWTPQRCDRCHCRAAVSCAAWRWLWSRQRSRT
jgi:hypothetical protein